MSPAADRTRPSRTAGVRSVGSALAALALAAVAACGVIGSDGETMVVGDVALDTTTTTPTSTTMVGTGGGSLSSGRVPARADGEPVVSMRTCESAVGDPSSVRVEAVVVNSTEVPQILQGVPLVVRDDAGRVVSRDEEDLWSSVTIGPGRRALLREDVDLDAVLRTDPEHGAIESVTCELGEPDLRPEPSGGGTEVPADALALDGCSPLVVSVENPTDRPVGVRVLVEAFDASGHSAGTFELGQWPTTYSDGREPGPDEVALPAREAGRYEADPDERIAQWETPLDGPVVGCEVVASWYETDPEAHEVIVD